MHPFTFKREAKWLLAISLVPVVGVLLAIIWPVIARWLGGRW